MRIRTPRSDSRHNASDAPGTGGKARKIARSITAKRWRSSYVPRRCSFHSGNPYWTANGREPGGSPSHSSAIGRNPRMKSAQTPSRSTPRTNGCRSVTGFAHPRSHDMSCLARSLTPNSMAIGVKSRRLLQSRRICRGRRVEIEGVIPPEAIPPTGEPERPTSVHRAWRPRLADAMLPLWGSSVIRRCTRGARASTWKAGWLTHPAWPTHPSGRSA